MNNTLNNYPDISMEGAIKSATFSEKTQQLSCFEESFDTLSSTEIICIFLEVPIKDVITNCKLVCRRWTNIIRSERFWARFSVYNGLRTNAPLKFIHKLKTVFKITEKKENNHDSAFPAPNYDKIMKDLHKFVCDLNTKYMLEQKTFPFKVRNYRFLNEIFVPLKNKLPKSIQNEYGLGYVRPFLLRILKDRVEYSETVERNDLIRITERGDYLETLLDESLINIHNVIEYMNEDAGNIYQFEHFVYTNIPEKYSIPKSILLWLKIVHNHQSLLDGNLKLCVPLFENDCLQKYFELFIEGHPLLKIHYSLYTDDIFQNMEPLKNIYEWVPLIATTKYIGYTDISTNALYFNANINSEYYGWIILIHGLPSFNIRILAKSFEEFVLSMYEDDSMDSWWKKCSIVGADYYEKNKVPINLGTCCDGCQQYPMHGVRYHCVENCNFDLCEICKDKYEHEHELVEQENNGKRSFFNTDTQQVEEENI